MVKDQKIIKSKSSTVWTIVVNAILVLLIMVGVLIAVSLLPFKNNYRILAVMSGSMEPTIGTGALIIIKPVQEYKDQDIITFRTPNSNKKNDYTTHRIVKTETSNGNKTYVTKGDANKTDDTERVTQSEIVGKEFFSIALLGYVLGYIKTLPGLLIIVVVPAVIIVYEEINKIKSEAQRIINEKKKLKKAKNGKDSKKS
jgi:signal peptidase